MITLSVIKAGAGGFVGHTAVHPDLVDAAQRAMNAAIGDHVVLDGRVAACGDDLALIVTHEHGADAEPVHEFAWTTFRRTTEVAKRLGLYGAGQDLLSDTFDGNLRGTGASYAELEFTERASDPMVCFLAGKTSPGAWNLPLYKIFADPFNTAGLVLDSKMHAGFEFDVHDLSTQQKTTFDCPAELYDLLMFIGAPGRYVVHAVRSKALAEQAAVTSTQRLDRTAGHQAGNDGPVMIVRCHDGLPTVGEALEPFAFPYTVAGAVRGSHHAPLMPVGAATAHPTRLDGPPRAVALGFQVTSGRLVGPRDLFTDPSFDRARALANEAMDNLRRHGPFEPHRLTLPELEHTPVHYLQQRLSNRWRPIADLPLPLVR